jgi:hypothetical protein
VTVKGLAGAMEVYEVTGADAARTRRQASARDDLREIRERVTGKVRGPLS